jgi:hypothetical protein
MSKLLFLLVILGQMSLTANPANLEQEMALEELFNEEDLAALKDEDEVTLFEEIPEGTVEELFQ